MLKKGILILCGIAIITSVFWINFYHKEELVAKKDVFLEVELSEQQANLIFHKTKTLNQEGIGLVIEQDGKSLSSSATTLLDAPVTWNVSGVMSKGENKSYEVLYGVTSHEVNRLELIINDKEFQPKLLENTSSNLIWYIIVDNIKEINSVKGYTRENVIIYDYPVK